MTELEQIEKSVKDLSEEDLTKFRSWFLDFDWQVWDVKIERDLDAGKLDRLIAEARADYEAGKAREP